ncbi:MAG: hypothetical protein E2577_05900, partial [Starkeya sp.]|nr:hypothetical protein [Starkeya sp.]
GWPAFAAAIDARRREIGATAILTNDYQMTAMLKRELPGVTVRQFDERQRYAFMNESEPPALSGPLLLVLSTYRSFNEIASVYGRTDLGEVSRRFRDVTMPPVRLFRLDPVAPPPPSPVSSAP